MREAVRKVFKTTTGKLLLAVAFLAMVGGSVYATNTVVNQNSPTRYSAVEANVAGGECDNNAIIRCGVTKSQLPGAYSSLDGVGKSAFNDAKVPGTCSFNNAVVGVVTRDNKVLVNNQVVATNVYTYGRQPIQPGSTQIPGGAWKRHPSVSFKSSQITAYVCMDGKEFKWAVISTCGNPVTGTPTHKNNPKIGIVKTSNVTDVQPGDKFNYTITVTNLGNVALHNVVVADILPQGLEPVNLGSGITYNASTRKVTWPTVVLFPVGTSFTRTLRVEVKENAPERLRNIACVISNQNPNAPICDDVYVNVKKPVYTCDELKVNQVNRTTFDFKTKYTAKNGATFKSIKYDFGDGTVQDTTNTGFVQHVYQNAGTYDVKSKVTFTVNGQDKVVGGPNCKTSVTVSNQNPVYTCNDLTATKINDTTYRFNVATTAQNGATVKSFAYNFGDGSAVVNSANSQADHTYAQSGNYMASVAVTFTVNGADQVVNSNDCKVQVEVNIPEEPVYTCNDLTATKINDTTYRFNVATTAQNGATVKSFAYNFGDGSAVVNSANSQADHTYAQSGNYMASVAVTFTVNGADQVVNSNDCKVQVTIQPNEPVYTCDALTINKVADLKYSFTVRYTAQNGATLKNVAYSFGDNSPVLNTTNTTVEHTYAQAGEYNAAAVLTFTVNGEDKVVASNNCKATTDKPPVTTPMCEVPGKENYPANSPECKPDQTEYCTIPGKENLPADSPDCVLPNTGIGDLYGLMTATTVAGIAAHHVFNLRRFI